MRIFIMKCLFVKQQVPALKQVGAGTKLRSLIFINVMQAAGFVRK